MHFHHLCYCLASIFFSVQSIFCCDYGNITVSPESQTIIMSGESAQLTCSGYGSHLNWFINGINTLNMTSQEISNRGLNFNGTYNQHQLYGNYSCSLQFSVLELDSSCVNNNSQIYCVIFGDSSEGNTTSNTSTITIQGVDVIENLNIFYGSENYLDMIIVSWELVTTNYDQHDTDTLSLVIQTSQSTKTSELDISTRSYIYSTGTSSSSNSNDSCVKYDITLKIKRDNTTYCLIDTATLTKYLSKPELSTYFMVQKAEVGKYGELTTQFIDKLNSLVCLSLLQITIKLILLNNDSSGGDGIQLSDAMSWGDSVTALPGEVYQVEWSNFNIRDDTHYQLLIQSEVKHTSIQSALSNSFSINTHSVIDVQYTVNYTTKQICVSCSFRDQQWSSSTGCVVSFIQQNKPEQVTQGVSYYVHTFSLINYKGKTDCVIPSTIFRTQITENDSYLMSVYDWKYFATISDEPALEPKIIQFNETIEFTSIYEIDDAYTEFVLMYMFIGASLTLILLIILVIVISVVVKVFRKSKVHDEDISNEETEDTSVQVGGANNGQIISTKINNAYEQTSITVAQSRKNRQSVSVHSNSTRSQSSIVSDNTVYNAVADPDHSNVNVVYDTIDQLQEPGTVHEDLTSSVPVEANAAYSSSVIESVRSNNIMYDTIVPEQQLVDEEESNINETSVPVEVNSAYNITGSVRNDFGSYETIIDTIGTASVEADQQTNEEMIDEDYVYNHL